VLSSRDDVVRALITYTDWWQPVTASVYEVGAARRASSGGDGIRAGLLETMPVREELSRRMERLEDRERKLLFLWYVKQDEVLDIARALHISRRSCFRLRAAALRTLADEEPDRAAS
jgi:DNA-directed RNA polymerase specialized sigma24 family protein